MLGGYFPFDGETDNQVYKAIKSKKYNFYDEEWKNVSNEAKDLILHMLAPEKERYTAKQVINHPWFKNASNIPLTDLNFDSNFFENYLHGSPLKKVSLLFIASRLDENEIKDLKKVFEAFDKEKDGQISIDELQKGLLQLKSTRFNNEEILNLFKTIDVDKNGRIDYTEFLAATLQERNYLQKEKLYEAFCVFDKDNSGHISKKELMEVLKTQKTQEGEIEKYIKAADKNGDGVIDYKEFLYLMGYED
jgi:calcium-dependent protein kinase